MKFKFAYENLMKSKKINRDIAFRNFSQAQGKLEQDQTVLHAYEDGVTDSLEFNQEIVESGILLQEKLEALKWTQEFLEGQKIKIQRQQEVVRKQNLIVDDKRKELSEAAKEYKVFEKLKERLAQKFAKLEKKRELKAVDEIVVMRAARNSQAGHK